MTDAQIVAELERIRDILDQCDGDEIMDAQYSLGEIISQLNRRPPSLYNPK